ncbi:hypothetical protein YC2023_010203 [Brassica napus]
MVKKFRISLFLASGGGLNLELSCGRGLQSCLGMFPIIWSSARFFCCEFFKESKARLVDIYSCRLNFGCPEHLQPQPIIPIMLLSKCHIMTVNINTNFRRRRFSTNPEQMLKWTAKKVDPDQEKSSTMALETQFTGKKKNEGV